LTIQKQALIEARMKSLSEQPEKDYYLNVFFIRDGQVVKQSHHWYKEKEALNMYQRGVNKYKDKHTSTVLICLRDDEHQLIKSELITQQIFEEAKRRLNL
jgi:hypothetical protein